MTCMRGGSRTARQGGMGMERLGGHRWAEAAGALSALALLSSGDLTAWRLVSHDVGHRLC